MPPPRPAARLAVGAVVAAGAITLAGCSGSAAPVSPSSPANIDNVQIIHPKPAFQAKTLSDWKTLGDAIVIAEVTDSRADTSPQGNPNLNGGVYGRIVTLSIRSDLWHRDPAHQPPGSFDMNAWGWVQRGNAKQPIVARGEPRLEVNHTYLLVLGKFATGWAPLGDGSEAPFDQGSVGYGEWDGHDPNDSEPAIDDLLNMNATQVQNVINQTKPDPRAAKYSALDPTQRAKKLGMTG